MLWAVGRSPATQHLNLAAAGVSTVATGHIPVDDFENTNIPGVYGTMCRVIPQRTATRYNMSRYAIGDVAEGGWELTPVAIAAGRRLADRLFGGVAGKSGTRCSACCSRAAVQGHASSTKPSPQSCFPTRPSAWLALLKKLRSQSEHCSVLQHGTFFLQHADDGVVGGIMVIVVGMEGRTWR